MFQCLRPIYMMTYYIRKICAPDFLVKIHCRMILLTKGVFFINFSSRNLNRSAYGLSTKGVKIISFKSHVLVFPRAFTFSGEQSEAAFGDDRNCTLDHFQKLGEHLSEISFYLFLHISSLTIPNFFSSCLSLL